MIHGKKNGREFLLLPGLATRNGRPNANPVCFLNGTSDLCLFGALQGSSGVMVHKTPKDKSESCLLILQTFQVSCKFCVKGPLKTYHVWVINNYQRNTIKSIWSKCTIIYYHWTIWRNLCSQAWMLLRCCLP